MKLSPFLYKFFMSLYPPYLGAGVRIKSVSKDWKEIQVMMTRYWFNKNVMGTHFGGSLYSMTDPHIMFMIMNHLGKDYIVWDKAADINFIKAVKEKIVAKITITNQDIDEIKKATENGEKYLPKYTIDIKTEDGILVASVIKTLYIRKKQPRKG